VEEKLSNGPNNITLARTRRIISSTVKHTDENKRRNIIYVAIINIDLIMASHGDAARGVRRKSVVSSDHNQEMVHRPSDSRLLANLLTSEKDYSKHFSLLLDDHLSPSLVSSLLPMRH
jgi:hypothetical protein